MLNGAELDDAATSGDSDAATKLFKSAQHAFLNECTQQSTQQPFLEDDQELEMGNEFRSAHSIDLKFYISELALKYNNSNIATAFNLSLKQVKEWKKQNMLLKQAYCEKNAAVRETRAKKQPEFGFSPSALSFTGAAEFSHQTEERKQHPLNAEPPTVAETSNPTSTSKTRKKSSYSSEYKLKAVAFAEMATNRAAAREFNVHEKRIREWRKNKEILMNSPKDCRRLKGAGRKPLLNQQIEEVLYNWIIKTSNERTSITKVELQQKALELSQKNIPEAKFTASSAWVEGFLKRHNLTVKDPEEPVLATSGSYNVPTMVTEEAHLYNTFDSLMEDEKKKQEREIRHTSTEDSSSSSIPYTKGM